VGKINTVAIGKIKNTKKKSKERKYIN